MDQEKSKLLEKIHNEVIERYKKADVPMIFKTKDCADDEWYGKNLNTGKFSKIKFTPTDGGTKIDTLWSE